MDDALQIKENLKKIHAEINAACTKANRNADEVKLLMATKTVEPARIEIAVNTGEQLIGENKVQEYVEKAAALKDLHCERHFIGHLQTNKVKDVLKYVTCIQSVDRINLAEKLDHRLQLLGRSLDIFVQINTSFEASKFGISPNEALSLVKEINALDTLKIKGFMTIGLLSTDAQMVKKSYRLLREIKDHAIDEGLLTPDNGQLSMGMSNDLEWAIAEGATMVRVGSAIFGHRAPLSIKI